MDIDLQTYFTSSLLPASPAPGFSDNFDRLPGPLGKTSGEGRAWKYFSSDAVANWQINASGRARLASGGGLNIAAVDAFASDGTLALQFMANSGSNTHSGPAFRVQDINNHYFIQQPTADEGIVLYLRQAGTATRLYSGTTTLKPNDIITVTLQGTTISVGVNGTTKFTVTDSTFMGETRHGIFVNNDSTGYEWDNASFTAA